MSEEELFKQSTWYGDWKTKGKIIFSKRRKFTINSYIFNLKGQSEITSYTSHQSLNQEEIRILINQVLDDFKHLDNIDYEKSFITVSC